MLGFRKKTAEVSVSAVIVAAGASSRMEGVDKQREPLDEIPVVVRAILAFSQCARIAEIVLVCREELIADYYALTLDYELDKVASVVGGGRTRQESVFRGVAACKGNSALLAIHDGARPLVDAALIDGVIDDALRYGAAAAGVPVKDTIKVRDQDGFIASTPKRETLAAIQTPQIFDAAIYRAAMELARKENCDYTDDCQLVEQTGRRVFISNGSYQNIKITTPEDLAVADALLTFREEEMGQ